MRSAEPGPDPGYPLLESPIERGGRSSTRLEHQVVVLGVGGSSPLGHPRWSPVPAFSYTLRRALSSARLERQTLNLRVTGSNPVGPTGSSSRAFVQAYEIPRWVPSLGERVSGTGRRAGSTAPFGLHEGLPPPLDRVPVVGQQVPGSGQPAIRKRVIPQAFAVLIGMKSATVPSPDRGRARRVVATRPAAGEAYRSMPAITRSTIVARPNPPEHNEHRTNSLTTWRARIEPLCCRTEGELALPVV